MQTESLSTYSQQQVPFNVYYSYFSLKIG